MNTSQYLSNFDTSAKENHGDIITVKEEPIDTTEQKFATYTSDFSTPCVVNPAELPDIAPVEPNEYKITIDEAELFLLNDFKYENTGNKNNEKVRGSEAVEEIVNVCDKKIKLECVFFEDNNLNCADETETECKVEIKLEQKICDNSIRNDCDVGNLVKIKRTEREYFIY